MFRFVSFALAAVLAAASSQHQPAGLDGQVVTPVRLSAFIPIQIIDCGSDAPSASAPLRPPT